MIHLIYIYFIINAFIAGLFAKEDYKISILCMFFGCLSPLYFLWVKFASITEIRTFFDLYFTNRYKGLDRGVIDVLEGVYRNTNKYKRWVIKQIDKKYNYGITK